MYIACLLILYISSIVHDLAVIIPGVIIDQFLQRDVVDHVVYAVPDLFPDTPRDTPVQVVAPPGTRGFRYAIRRGKGSFKCPEDIADAYVFRAVCQHIAPLRTPDALYQFCLFERCE